MKPAASVGVDPVVAARLKDLLRHAQSHASALGGAANCDWEKLNRGGGGEPSSDDYLVADILARGLFSRDELNSAYITAAASKDSGSQRALEQAKLQVYLLQALQRGTVMRYARGRMWALAAAHSRRRGLGDGEQAQRVVAYLSSRAVV